MIHVYDKYLFPVRLILCHGTSVAIRSQRLIGHCTVQVMQLSKRILVTLLLYFLCHGNEIVRNSVLYRITDRCLGPKRLHFEVNIMCHKKDSYNRQEVDAEHQTPTGHESILMTP